MSFKTEVVLCTFSTSCKAAGGVSAPGTPERSLRLRPQRRLLGTLMDRLAGQCGRDLGDLLSFLIAFFVSFFLPSFFLSFSLSLSVLSISRDFSHFMTRLLAAHGRYDSLCAWRETCGCMHRMIEASNTRERDDAHGAGVAVGIKELYTVDGQIPAPVGMDELSGIVITVSPCGNESFSKWRTLFWLAFKLKGNLKGRHPLSIVEVRPVSVKHPAEMFDFHQKMNFTHIKPQGESTF